MDISEFEVILRMDWLTAYRVVIDYDRTWVTAYTQDVIVLRLRGRSMMLYQKHDALPQTVHNSRWSRQLMGWLASLTLEDEVR